MVKEEMSRSFIFKGFRKTLVAEFGEETAAQIWKNASANHIALKSRCPDVTSDSRMMVLPAAALLGALKKHVPERALPLLMAYGTQTGEKIAKIVHAITSIPGMPKLLWKAMPRIMRSTSSPKKGYTRRIISETNELVGVDILSCPLHDTAVKIGMPEAALIVCAMDKAYMTGFRHIRYTRATSVAEGAGCCDYRLAYDKNKQ